MQLLVSVADVGEARAALRGGAAIIDAKDPTRGSLGAVTRASFRAIRDAVGDRCPVSAALGEHRAERAVASAAHRCAADGAAFVKVGFRGLATVARVTALAEAAVGAVARSHTRIILVACADSARARALAPLRVLEIAARTGAGGVLLDTAHKDRGGLFTLMAWARVATFVACAHDLGLLAALAGSLDADGIAEARALGADIAGVRGAACEGGQRTGRVSAVRVRALAAVAGESISPGAPAASRPRTPPLSSTERFSTERFST